MTSALLSGVELEATTSQAVPRGFLRKPGSVREHPTGPSQCGEAGHSGQFLESHRKTLSAYSALIKWLSLKDMEWLLTENPILSTQNFLLPNPKTGWQLFWWIIWRACGAFMLLRDLSVIITSKRAIRELPVCSVSSWYPPKGPLI